MAWFLCQCIILGVIDVQATIYKSFSIVAGDSNFTSQYQPLLQPSNKGAIAFHFSKVNDTGIGWIYNPEDGSPCSSDPHYELEIYESTGQQTELYLSLNISVGPRNFFPVFLNLTFHQNRSYYAQVAAYNPSGSIFCARTPFYLDCKL